jgi:hypothetical protein
MDDARIMDECAILGFGIAHKTPAEIAHFRKDPGPGRPQAMTYQLLRHADEHTILALAAMLHCQAHFSPKVPLEEWGIVAAPRWPGRQGTATALERFRADGPHGVSPMAIPNVCLHSLSATVSLVFELKGPNFGVGGGLANITDGLMTALSVQLEHKPPGTFVIFSEWNVEPGQVESAVPPVGQALVLALGAVEQDPCAPRLVMKPVNVRPKENGFPRLSSLSAFLLDPAANKSSWTCSLDWGMELVVGRIIHHRDTESTEKSNQDRH